MNIAVTIARILLGLIFGTGISAFFIASPPPMAGLAAAFQDVFFRSHYSQFVGSVEFIAGALLLLNRYVPLALTILAAVIANIFFFHLSMAPEGLAAPVVVSGLWLVVALRHRARFEGLLAPGGTIVPRRRTTWDDNSKEEARPAEAGAQPLVVGAQ